MSRVINHRLVVFATIAFMVGIFVGGLVFNNIILTIVIPLAMLLCGIIFYFASKKFIVLLLFVTFAIGSICYVIDYNINVKDINDNAVISGRISQLDNKSMVLSNISIDGKKHRGKVYLTDGYGNFGDIITYYGTIKTLKFDIFDTYSMNSYNDDVFYESNFIYIKDLSAGKINIFEKINNKTTLVLDKYMTKEDTGIVKSLLFGDKSSLIYQDNMLIRRAGVSHIFAVSGLHVGFLIGLLIFILRKLRAKPSLQIIVVGVLIFLYGFLCGFPAGLKRAGIMAIVYLLANLTCNKNDNLTTLSLSIMIILIMNPLEMFDLGFLMSVTAVFGIILFYKPIYAFLAYKFTNKAYLFVAGSFALTLSANVFLLPISCNIFQSLSVYMLLSNLIIVPLVSIAYSSLILIATLSLIFEGFGIFYTVAKYPVIAIRAVCKIINVLPLTTLALPALGIFTFTYIASFIILSRFIMVKPKIKIISIGGLTGLSVLIFLLI